MTVIIHTNYIFEKSISIIITILVSLIFIEAGMVAFIFACIVFHFPSKPKHPPSITSTMERTAFLPSLYNICTNRQVYIIFSLISTICIFKNFLPLDDEISIDYFFFQALLMTFSFAFFNGLIASWFCVMDITFKHLPIADAEDMVRS